MKTIFIDKLTKEATIYTVKTDLCKRMDICASTLWLWSKEKIKETKEYIICFDVLEYKNKTKKRNNNF